MRCNCHLLNLVATTDVGKITNPIFKKTKRALDGKLQAIWNAQSRSTCSADFIRLKLGLMFVLPNKTRWNSYYDALVRVRYFINLKNGALKEVFAKEGVPVLRPQEEEFLKEMVKIFQPLTEALDVFQNEQFMSVGCVLPTLCGLLEKYKTFVRDSSIVHCRVLVNALITAIRSRFDHLLREPQLRLASLSDPHFKTMWIADEHEKADDVSRLKEEVLRRKSSDSLTLIDEDSNQSDDIGSPSRKRKRTLFDGFRKKRNADFDEVDKYLSEDIADIDSDFTQLDRYPAIKEIFIEYNAALPSSAACERLFSTAGLIFTPKRSRLSDGNFEKLTFMKINDACYRNWSVQPAK